MTQVGPAGARIRSRRIEMGRSQQSLAKALGISASYLNLIEHDKRRIGGTVLVDVAKALGVDPSVLTEPVDTKQLGHLGAVAGGGTEAADVFAERFPGWASVVTEQANVIAALEAKVAVLTDRVAHDPTLAGALHQVVSTVTSIRSTASILVGGAGDRDWEARFHQNIYGDSLRLAEVTQALASYLEGAPEANAMTAEQEAVAFCEARGHFFEQVERGDAVSLDALSDGAREIMVRWLGGYSQDARALPLAGFAQAAGEEAYDPGRLAARFEQPLARVLRRLACLPARDGQPAMGLAICDGAGVVTYQKRIDGFDMAAGGCPLWPLYQALGQVTRPVRRVVAMPQAEAPRLTAYAVAEHIGAAQFDGPVIVQSVMLVVADAPTTKAQGVGPGCAKCPRDDCAARRSTQALRL